MVLCVQLSSIKEVPRIGDLGAPGQGRFKSEQLCESEGSLSGKVTRGNSWQWGLSPNDSELTEAAGEH